MDDLKQFEKHLRENANKIKGFLEGDALEIIEVEQLNTIEEAFDNEGFTNSSLEKWKKRKTTDRTGNDITRYRTNRVGRRGDLNQHGRRNKGRSILTGHNSGGNKLRYSYRASKINGGVRFATDKPYAKRHNEGLKGMPKRKHAGRSQKADKRILKKFNTRIEKILK